MKAKIYFNRSKEENWELLDKCEELGYENTESLKYVGYEVEFDVEVDQASRVKVMKIQGVDVSDKEIFV